MVKMPADVKETLRSKARAHCHSQQVGDPECICRLLKIIDDETLMIADNSSTRQRRTWRRTPRYPSSAIIARARSPSRSRAMSPSARMGRTLMP